MTPSNVPTNFCYSFAFGLLTGNANIVKVHVNFPQVDIICKIKEYSITKDLERYLKIIYLLDISQRKVILPKNIQNFRWKNNVG